jgi:hypothetical protein
MAFKHIETALYEILRNDAGVSALVGTRVYLGRLPDNTIFPAVSFQRITTTKPQTLTTRVTFRNSLIQVDSWARTGGEIQALNLGAAVYGALEAIRGIYSTVDIQGILIDNEEFMPPEPDIEVSRVRQIFRILYQEE